MSAPDSSLDTTVLLYRWRSRPRQGVGWRALVGSFTFELMYTSCFAELIFCSKQVAARRPLDRSRENTCYLIVAPRRSTALTCTGVH
jgi:hypothetical protein